MDKLSVVKSNELIKACFRLELNETRLLYYAIAKANPMENPYGWKDYYEIRVSDIAEIFCMDKKGAYKDMLDASNSFFERQFTILTANKERHKGRFIDLITYHEGKGLLAIKFSEAIRPFLSHLKGNFTSYRLSKIVNFKTPNSVRIYEISIMELKKTKKKTAEFLTSISTLKEQLNLEDKYKRFNQFKERILEKAKDEINKHSDITLSFEIIKKGRTPSDIKFLISYKTGKEPKHHFHQENQVEKLKFELKNVLQELKPFRTKSSFTREEDIARLKLEKRRSELKSQLEKLSKSA